MVAGEEHCGSLRMIQEERDVKRTKSNIFLTKNLLLQHCLI